MKFAVVVSILLSPGLVWAGSHTRIGATELDRSERYIFESSEVGDRFRIDVLLPIGYSESKERYPVVYVTDANYLLYSAAATYLAQATDEFQKIVIVGIGWDVDSIARIRVRDLTPTCDQEYQSNRSLKDNECGQADNFAKFIGKELQPVIDKTYRTTKDNTLVGYSFGGLFALHVLFNQSQFFDRYVIGSASMEWDEEYVFRAEQEYAKDNKDLAKSVYLSAGGLEGNQTIPNAYLMFEQLLERKYPKLKIEMEVLEGETHMTNISPTVMRGLRSVFQGYR